MTTLVTRLYASPDKAKAAAAELEKNKFHDNEVFLVGPPGPGEDATASLTQAGLSKAAAAPYAEGLAKGGAVVVVHAAFGAGMRAGAVLDRFSPTKVAAPAAATASSSSRAPTAKAPYDEATPASSTFGWPVLSDDPTPLSTKAGWALLSDFNFSKNFGFSLLSDNPTPLSSALGWAVLKHDDPTPLSNKAGWPVLRDDPTPLSNKFNWPLLRD